MASATSAKLMRASIHDAERAADGSGAVVKGAVIDERTAIARRRAGLDVVVCGDDLRSCRATARAIEDAVGRWVRQTPHKSGAGPFALPHFQQETPPPAGHTFYETPNCRAKNR